MPRPTEVTDLGLEPWTTYPAHAHALPFRTILGEYRVRRPLDLARAVLMDILNLERRPEDLANAKLAEILTAANSSEASAATAAQRILKGEHPPGGDLATALAKHILKLDFTVQEVEAIWTRLGARIPKAEDAYGTLELAKETLQAQRATRAEKPPDFKKRLVEAYEKVLVAGRVCQVYDRPVKKIL